MVLFGIDDPLLDIEQLAAVGCGVEDQIIVVNQSKRLVVGDVQLACSSLKILLKGTDYGQYSTDVLCTLDAHHL